MAFSQTYLLLVWIYREQEPQWAITSTDLILTDLIFNFSGVRLIGRPLNGGFTVTKKNELYRHKVFSSAPTIFMKGEFVSAGNRMEQLL